MVKFQEYCKHKGYQFIDASYEVVCTYNITNKRNKKEVIVEGVPNDWVIRKNVLDVQETDQYFTGLSTIEVLQHLSHILD